MMGSGGDICQERPGPPFLPARAEESQGHRAPRPTLSRGSANPGGGVVHTPHSAPAPGAQSMVSGVFTGPCTPQTNPLPHCPFPGSPTLPLAAPNLLCFLICIFWTFHMHASYELHGLSHPSGSGKLSRSVHTNMCPSSAPPED